jgi:hypothetical protein
MTNPSVSTQETQQLVLGAIGHILRPLIRLLLAHGITFTVFSDVVRSIYVKVAEEEFTLRDKAQTDSRVSLLTGIHRREVNRLRNERMQEIALPQHASMSALLLATWSGHPDYLDSHGLPVALPRLASKGGGRSFESLVQSISKDFRARVVLDEWLRQGIVEIDADDNVHLSAEAFVLPRDTHEKVFYFGQNIHDHLAATVHNLAGAAPPFLERCVFYDKLSAESVRELADYSHTAGMRALHAVNKRAAELQKRDRSRTDAVHRSNFGVYQYSAVEASYEDPPS